MRIIHFADLHIGVENYSRTDPETGLSTRLLDFLNALDQLVEYALTHKANLVLLAGDAYKSRDPNQTQQREFARRLATLSSAGIPVFLLVGNHDLPNAMGRATAIEIFNTLEVPRLHVGDEISNYLIETPSGPLQITALPWPKRSALLTREDTRGLSIEKVNERLQTILAQDIRTLSEKLDPNLPAILAGHVTVNGAKLGSERAMMLGQDHSLRPSDVHLPAYDYIALGHIHKHQVVRDNPLMVYSGSLQRVDFGEENDPKGFCVIDLDPERPQGRRLTGFRFEEVAARAFTTIDVNLPPITPDPTKDVLSAIQRSSLDEAIVRLRISLTADQSVRLRMGEIREALKPAHHVASIQTQVSDERRARLPADAARNLDTITSLSRYLESRSTDAPRREKLITYAKTLIDEDMPDPQPDNSLTPHPESILNSSKDEARMPPSSPSPVLGEGWGEGTSTVSPSYPPRLGENPEPHDTNETSTK